MTSVRELKMSADAIAQAQTALGAARQKSGERQRRLGDRMLTNSQRAAEHNARRQAKFAATGRRATEARLQAISDVLRFSITALRASGQSREMDDTATTAATTLNTRSTASPSVQLANQNREPPRRFVRQVPSALVTSPPAQGTGGSTAARVRRSELGRVADSPRVFKRAARGELTLARNKTTREFADQTNPDTSGRHREQTQAPWADAETRRSQSAQAPLGQLSPARRASLRVTSQRAMAGGTLSREDRTTQVDSGIESVSAIAESQAVRDGRRAVPEFFAREEPGLIERGGELRKIELDLKTRAEFEITFANSSREQVAQLTAEISKVITERDKAMLAAIEQKFNSQQFAETLGQQLNAATQ